MRKLIVASITAFAIAIATIPLNAIGGLPGFTPGAAYADGAPTVPTNIVVGSVNNSDGTVTLTATLNGDISNSSAGVLNFYEDTNVAITGNGAISTASLGSATSGITASVTLPRPTTGFKAYDATLGTITSNFVIVTSASTTNGVALNFGVTDPTNGQTTLTPSYNFADNYVPKLTWVSSYSFPVLTSPTSLRVYMVDTTTGLVLVPSTATQLGGTGSTQSAPYKSFYTGNSHVYEAVVAYYVSGLNPSSVNQLQGIQYVSATASITRKPWTVSLNSSANTFSTTATTPSLSWQSNQDIADTGTSPAYQTYLVDQTSNTILAVQTGTATNVTDPASPTGTSLESNGSSPITRFYTGNGHTYIAYVAASGATTVAGLTDIQTQSATVTIQRTTWTIGLSVSGQYFSTTDPLPTVSWTINQPVSGTGVAGSLAYSIFVEDQTTGTIFSTVTSSSLMGSATIPSFNTGGAHNYIAYVAATGSTASSFNDIQASSNVVSSQRAPWTITENSNYTTYTTDQYPTIGWSANQTLNPTGSTIHPYAAYTFNQTTGALAYIGGGTNTPSGSSSYTKVFTSTNVPQTYVSYIASLYTSDGVTKPTSISQLYDIQATSASITLQRAQWHSSTTFSGTGIYNVWQAADAIAASGPQFGGSGSIQTVLNQPLVAPYNLYMVNSDTGAISYWQTPGYGPLTFGMGIPWPQTGGPENVYTVVATSSVSNPSNVNQLQDIEAQGATYTITRAPWNITTTCGHSQSNSTTESSSCSMTANQPFGTYELGTLQTVTPYRAYLVRNDTGLIVGRTVFGGYPGWGTGGSGGVSSSPKGQSPSYTAYVASQYGPDGSTVPNYVYDLVDIQATSGSVNPDANDNYQLASETTGGSNPSSKCTSGCSGDPVNTQTLEYSETNTDLPNISATTPPLDFTRTYAGTANTTNSAGMGYGWTNNYNMSAVKGTQSVNGGTPGLGGESIIQIIQENGSVVNFTAMGNGVYSAKNNFRASLAYNAANNTIIFTRDKTSQYVFDALTGKLINVIDRNNNQLTLAYNTDGTLNTITNGVGQNITLTWASGQLTQVANSSGQTVSYSYNGNSDLTNFTDVNNHITQYVYTDYSGTGVHDITKVTQPNSSTSMSMTYNLPTNATAAQEQQVKTQTDENGNTTTFATTNTNADPFDAGFGNTTITHPDGSKTCDHYAYGELASETIGYGTSSALTWNFNYDNSGNLTKTWNPDNSTTTSTYDNSGNMLTRTDELGRTTTTTYNSYNEPLTVTDPAGHITSYTYDTHGNPLTATNAAGNTTTYTNNSQGKQTLVTSPLGSTTGYVYGSNGFLNSTTNALGYQTTYTLDSNGRPTQTTDANGNSIQETYNAAGQVITETDAQGNVLTNIYNSKGQQIGTVYPNGTSSSTNYDGVGNPLSKMDATGHTTSYVYDSMGRVTQTTDPKGNISHQVYNILGQMVSSTDPLGHITTYTYNWRNQVLTITSPTGKVTTNTYDIAGQKLTSTDPIGNVTTYTYDVDGNVSTIKDALNQTTTITYNALNQATTVHRPDGTTVTATYNADGKKTGYTDAAGNISTYTYNLAGQIVETNEAGIDTTYSYDPVGNLTSSTTGTETTSYTYNNRDDLTKILSNDASVPEIDYTYNIMGQKATMVDGSGTTAYSYDNLGRTTTATNTTTGTIGYTYDNNSNVTTLNYPNGNTTHYTYIANDQLASVQESHIGTIGYTYNNDGNQTSISYPNGVTTTTTYNANGNPTGIQSTNSAGASVLNDTYAYDANGQITLQGSTSPNSTTSNGYTYTSLGQVNSVTPTVSGTTGTAANYTFDSIGNVTGSPAGDTLSYNTRHELTSKTNSATGSAAYAYTYDSQGNRTETDITTSLGTVSNTYGYNGLNQLVAANLAANPPNPTALTYAYNGNGLLYQKTKTVNGTTATNNYIWDTTASIPTLLEDSNNVYIYADNSTPIAQINKTNGTVTYLHQDALGSVRATSDNTGTITSETTYDEYGNVTNQVGTSPTAFGYSGQYQDTDTGFYYLRARWHDPQTVQFTTVDPKLNTTHLAYAYTGGNPLEQSDPTGLDFWGDAAQFGYGVLGGITFGLSITLINGAFPGTVNTCSSAYQWGSAVGMVASFLIPGPDVVEILGNVARVAVDALDIGKAAERAVATVKAIGTRLADESGHVDYSAIVGKGPRLRANYGVGKEAEADYAKSIGLGNASREIVLTPSSGVVRRIDVLDSRSGTMNEIKVGRTSLTDATKAELKGEDDAITEKLEDVTNRNWVFYPSKANGKFGPTGPLEEAITSRGGTIEYRQWPADHS